MQKYFVVGVLKSKVLLPAAPMTLGSLFLYNAKVLYGSPSSSYNIIVNTSQANLMDEAVNHAIPIMRNARQLKISNKDDFEINKSDGILAKLKEMTTQRWDWSTIVIALLTLLGASIGLMNIMLVTVTERTRKLASENTWSVPKNDLTQFLMEAVMICLVGGIVVYLWAWYRLCCDCSCQRTSFHTLELDYTWHHSCIIVGVLSGLYPAFALQNLTQ